MSADLFQMGRALGNLEALQSHQSTSISKLNKRLKTVEFTQQILLRVVFLILVGGLTAYGQLTRDQWAVFVAEVIRHTFGGGLI